ncbi:DUF427 domain-containing protein [Rhodobacter calidifons]|uniref:DUF427 domain-containing protein n=1 Tax=Rhodobacter calidifons TaxID=2715277 RepID=A0ABX0GA81_9RHOB|nr:DUF427 domain-containing protein [Rhodobacter calidifons]NHB78189.1 DUF427 domain-containing protein [Rhodobacter calidifons]
MADHIRIARVEGPVTVRAGTTLLGTSARALELREGSYPPVIYVPREDIDMTRLMRTDHATSCPWKGKASYYSIKGDAGMLANAVWSYETPKPDVAEIAGHLAFYPDRVTVTRG